MPSIFSNGPSRSASLDSTGSGKSLSSAQSSAQSATSPFESTYSSASSSASSLSKLSHTDSRASSISSISIADHACSVLHGHNALRLYGFDEKAEKATKNVIHSFSAFIDLQHEGRLGERGEGCEFKFKRRMWQNSCKFTGRRCPGTTSQAFICAFLTAMEGCGYTPIVVSDVGYTDVENDAIYFRRTQPHQTHYFACQFDEGDKLRVTSAPDDIYKGFRHIFSKHKYKEDKGDGTSLFKLTGYPFICDSDSGHKNGPSWLCSDLFSASGHECMLSINMSGEKGSTSHARTWLVRKAPAWAVNEV